MAAQTEHRYAVTRSSRGRYGSKAGVWDRVMIYTDVPEIRIRALWLADAGICLGDHVRVRCVAPGRLEIVAESALEAEPPAPVDTPVA